MDGGIYRYSYSIKIGEYKSMALYSLYISFVCSTRALYCTAIVKVHPTGDPGTVGYRKNELAINRTTVLMKPKHEGIRVHHDFGDFAGNMSGWRNGIRTVVDT